MGCQVHVFNADCLALFITRKKDATSCIDNRELPAATLCGTLFRE